MDDQAGPGLQGGDVVRRHGVATRVWHWLNALTLLVMLMSGLSIFNAHPRLYWGQYGANADPAWFELAGRWPGWMTIPTEYSLADARLWHLAFALLLIALTLGYLVWSLIRGHLRRDLLPRRAELTPAHLAEEIRDHAQLRFPTGAAAARYNALQKIAYCAVLLGLLPLIILTGMTMSPQLNAGLPWLLDLFGGRQSARSLHFIAASGLVAFFVVHIAMVIAAGPINEVRSMITGRFRLPPDRPSGDVA